LSGGSSSQLASSRPTSVAAPGPGASGKRDDSPGRATRAIAGVVVCGGHSRRMGTDKARLVLGGRSLLEHVALELRGAVGEVVLARGPTERYGELGLPLALDAVPDGGPLAGIVAGPEATGVERILVVACDMPRVGAPLFEALIERARGAELDVLFLESARGVEPLCAVYGRRCLPAMRRTLARGERRVRAFVVDDPTLAVGRLRIDELPPALRGEDLAVNLNTPEELAREAAHRTGEEPR